jgi:hypothetical protein
MSREIIKPIGIPPLRQLKVGTSEKASIVYHPGTQAFLRVP